MMDTVLKVEVPPTMTRDEANARRADMIARGLAVWTFTRRDMTALVRVDGWWGWVDRHGYDPHTAEAVHVENPAESDAALIVGARLAVLCAGCAQPVYAPWPACSACHACADCCRCPRGVA